MGVFFGDNGNREKRTNELADDLSASLAIQVNYSHELNDKLTALNELAKQMLKKLEPDQIPTTVETKVNNLTLELVPYLSMLPTYKGATMVLEKYIKPRVSLFNLREERLLNNQPASDMEMLSEAESELLNKCEIPKELNLKWKAGAVVLAVAIAAIIELVEEAEVKKKFQEKIRLLVPAREKQKISEIKTRLFLEQVSAMLVAHQMHDNGLPYTKEDLENLVKTSINDFQDKLNYVTSDDAKRELADLDKIRKSWTNED